ncbi:MAG: hypothetical protein EHM54_10630 [Nitrospiraceae bacterium]|nr:MAG: hypothetical protein EHM54_10630 [Nitrospiraceae bacterium]
MEEIEELVRRYHLEEDTEHIIIPLPEKEGHARRCFILKRNFLMIQFPDGHFSDFPLAEIIEATVKYPELLLSESIHYVHKTPEISSIMEHSENENKVMIKENDEKENID